MPLPRGCDRPAIDKRIAILRHVGRPEKQAVAMSFKMANMYADEHGLERPARASLRTAKRRGRKGRRKASMRSAGKKAIKRSAVKDVRPVPLKQAKAKAKKSKKRR